MMIDIDHVSFQYSGAEQENLQDFNLQIKKGECVVLTGESGCGNYYTIRRRGSCKAVTVVRIARALNCEPEEIIIPES